MKAERIGKYRYEFFPCWFSIIEFFRNPLSGKCECGRKLLTGFKQCYKLLARFAANAKCVAVAPCAKYVESVVAQSAWESVRIAEHIRAQAVARTGIVALTMKRVRSLNRKYDE